jgi:hypothetical protein
MTNDRARQIDFRGVVSRHRDAVALLERAGDVVLVERGRPRHLVMMCPCGCGDVFSLNLDPEAGPCWRMLRRDPLTIVPSVWRDTGCESHFFVWKCEVDWLVWSIGAEPDGDLVTRVEQALRNELRSVPEIALEVDTSLGDVRAACRSLVAAGRAREGMGRDVGSFGRTGD